MRGTFVGLSAERLRLHGQWVFAGLALLHVLIVAAHAAYLPISNLPVIGGGVGFYGALSGADSTYGFFAPGVSGQVRARFVIEDGAGQARDVPLASGYSHEADLRTNAIVDEFTREGDIDLRHALAASLAGAVMGQHPDARRVTAIIERYDPPTMSAYRDGVRAAWVSLAEVEFMRAVTPQ